MKPPWGASLLAALVALAVCAACRALETAGLVGLFGDDGVYVLAARALHEGHGYVMLNVPGTPPVSRYPVGFPALLAVVLLGTRGVAQEVARCQWVAPCAAAMWTWLTWRLLWPRLGPWALPTAALVGFHPVALVMGSYVMSDLPCAVLTAAAIGAAEPAFDGARRPGRWAAVGALAGAAYLVRTAAIVLPVALVLACLRHRCGRQAWPALVAFLAFALPWHAWQASTHVAGYGPQLTEMMTRGLAAWLVDLPEVTHTFVTSGPAGMLAPWAFATPGAWSVPLGLAILAWLAFGLAVQLRRGNALAPLYVLGTLAMAFVWQFLFLELHDMMMSRLLLPVVPFAFLALYEGAAVVAWASPRVRRTLGALVITIALAATGAQGGRALAQARAAADRGWPQRDYVQAFDAIRAHVPEKAVLAGWQASMLSLYTDRQAYGLHLKQGLPEVEALVGAGLVQYVVGTPRVVVASEGAGKRHDHSIDVLNAFQAAHPGVLEPVWWDVRRRFVLFRVARHAE